MLLGAACLLSILHCQSSPIKPKTKIVDRYIEMENDFSMHGSTYEIFYDFPSIEKVLLQVCDFQIIPNSGF